MKSLRYIPNVATVTLERELCVGCSLCIAVCPHNVFALEEKRAVLIDKDACMECGACARNCPVGAIGVSPGVGCAALIINRWLKRKNVSSAGCC